MSAVILATAMRRPLALLLSLAAAAVTLAPAAARAELTGRLLVSLERPSDKPAQAAAARAVAARTNARRAGPATPQIGLVPVKPRPGETVWQLAERLRADPSVRAVTAESTATLRADPGDPALSTPEPAPGTPAGTTVQWWPARSGFTRAWDFTAGAGALVGVIDTGIDGSHPELINRIRLAEDQDSNPTHAGASVDEIGHGTHVASIACAQAGNGIALAGAGHSCDLIVEKSDLTDGSVARSIVAATDAGALAINMSFGTDGRSTPPQAIVDAIDYAYAHNVVLVAAAADDNVEEQGDPANILQPTGTGPNIEAGKGLVVTAATAADRRASYAGLGTQISVAAYGTLDERSGPGGLLGAFPANQAEIERPSLVPPAPPCRCRVSFDGDNRYAYLQGTSMAAPQVAALGALIRNLNPDLPIAAVLRLIKNTTRGDTWTEDLGWGIIDAGRAVEEASQVDLRAPTSSVKGPRRARARRVTLRVRSADPAPTGVVASGVQSVRIFRAEGTRKPVRVATTAPKERIRIRVRKGRTYSFYAQAVDRVGNVQPFPTRAGTRVRVSR
jgi:subtilisin family serine protease